MPIYDYQCVDGHRFDRMQKFSDDALDECEVCGKSARRVLHAPAVHYKGKGFYSTDYGSKKPKTDSSPDPSKSSDSASSKSEGTKSESTSTASSTPSSDSKPASKPAASKE